jgi:hypothetical protein
MSRERWEADLRWPGFNFGTAAKTVSARKHLAESISVDAETAFFWREARLTGNAGHNANDDRRGDRKTFCNGLRVAQHKHAR